MSPDPSNSDSEHARQPPDFLVVGRVLRPHGIRGALLVEPLSEVLGSLQKGSEVLLGPQNQPTQITSIRRHKKNYILAHDGAHDRNEAEEYRGAEVRLRFHDADPLAEDEYYYWQIIGLRVKTEEGRELGKIEEILETGANDVYVIRDVEANELLLPALKSVILQVDLANEEMIVSPLPGLLPDVT